MSKIGISLQIESSIILYMYIRGWIALYEDCFYVNVLNPKGVYKVTNLFFFLLSE